jgi:hypothetical protein
MQLPVLTTRPITYPWLCASREVTRQFGETLRQVWGIPIQDDSWIHRSDLSEAILKVTGELYNPDLVVNLARQQWGWEVVMDTNNEPDKVSIPQLFHYLAVVCGRVDKLHTLIYPFALAMQEWEQMGVESV